MTLSDNCKPANRGFGMVKVLIIICTSQKSLLTYKLGKGWKSLKSSIENCTTRLPVGEVFQSKFKL